MGYPRHSEGGYAAQAPGDRSDRSGAPLHQRWVGLATGERQTWGRTNDETRQSLINPFSVPSIRISCFGFLPGEKEPGVSVAFVSTFEGSVFFMFSWGYWILLGPIACV